MKNNIYAKVGNATKWSAITELLSKVVTPISNMALARILAPEAFGIVSTITMITSFADIFTDAGFQKYIIQHQFTDADERNDRYILCLGMRQLYALLALIPINMYNGERGRWNLKYVFYMFYPAHLLIIWFIWII